MNKNRKSSLLIVLVFVFWFCGVANSAEPLILDVIETQRKFSRDQIKELVSENLSLSSKEAEGFWPVYEEYRDVMKKINDKELEVIVEYADAYVGKGLGDDQAIKLVEKYLDAEKDKASIRKKYLKKFKRVLPPKKVAIFYQVDNRIDALMRVGTAVQIPLVESK